MDIFYSHDDTKNNSDVALPASNIHEYMAPKSSDECEAWFEWYSGFQRENHYFV
jgi:hypothetical protein